MGSIHSPPGLLDAVAQSPVDGQRVLLQLAHFRQLLLQRVDVVDG